MSRKSYNYALSAQWGDRLDSPTGRPRRPAVRRPCPGPTAARTDCLSGSMTGKGTPLRVGLVGYGLAGSVFHAPLIAATEGLILDTVVTSSPERREQARAEFPDVRFAASPDELWERSGELGPDRHRFPQQDARPDRDGGPEGGPARWSWTSPWRAPRHEARDLAALAEERGLLLSVFQNRRWDNDFLTLQAPDRGRRAGRGAAFRVPFRALAASTQGRLARVGLPRRRSAACCTTSAAMSSTRR